jgi:hypothetical protein
MGGGFGMTRSTYSVYERKATSATILSAVAIGNIARGVQVGDLMRGCT